MRISGGCDRMRGTRKTEERRGMKGTGFSKQEGILSDVNACVSSLPRRVVFPACCMYEKLKGT